MKYLSDFFGLLAEMFIGLLMFWIGYIYFAHKSTPIDSYVAGWVTAFVFVIGRKILIILGIGRVK